MFKPIVRTKNFTAKPIREGLIPSRHRTIIRFGSTTPTERIYPRGVSLNKQIIEINTVEAIENSRSKLLMKKCFTDAEIPHPDYYEIDTEDKIFFYILNSDLDTIHMDELPYPILAKREFGFKGHGMHKFDDAKSLDEWIQSNDLDGYYFEKFYSYSREYRLHCTEDGCFYACRKMLKEDAEDRYYRNDSNCVWFVEENPKFDKPINWAEIEEDCVKALKSTGLTIGAFDVKVQSAKDKDGVRRENPLYIIIEVNSAPAFGEVTLVKYTETINKIIQANNERNSIS